MLRNLIHDGELLANWGQWDGAVASGIAKVEVHRTLARVSQQARLTGDGLARATQAFADLEEAIRWLPVTPEVLAAACGPLPTVVKALDAIHLVTAQLLRTAGIPDLVFATHDRQLGLAAAAMGFEVAGV